MVALSHAGRGHSDARLEPKGRLTVYFTVSVLRGGSAVERWTCDLQVAGSIPSRWRSRNIGQLSLASLQSR